MQEYPLIERLRNSPGQPARVVMFDFDGTIGMVRAGWMPLMLDMMMETLAPLGPHPALLRDEAEDYVARLTGRDTVEQTNAFADHVRRLGGIPRSGAEYKAEFLARLEHQRSARLTALRAGTLPADNLMIPGTRAFLTQLRNAKLPVYLASGSDHGDICLEARLLGIDHFFAGIFGSAPGIPNKAQLLAQLVEQGFAPESILTFGDGRTEIEVTRAIGGRTVGVASDEPECLSIDPKKRGWLIDAGADYMIPNYLEFGLMDIVAAI
jgi:phosphoglycolate phosphatase